MLERYYVRPRTADRIRALWLGPAIDRYVGWLADRQAAEQTVKGAVQRLVHFNTFAQSRGVTTWEELPSHAEAFIAHWIQEHSAWCRTSQDRAAVRSQVRRPIEQLLRFLLPDFVGTQRRIVLPFKDSAPELFVYLGEERGLRPETIHRYRHHLGAFETYLNRIGNSDLSTLTPALLSTFIVESAERLCPAGVGARSGCLRVFLRYLHRQDLIATDLSRAVPRGRHYRQSSVPRSISAEEVQHVIDIVDRRNAIGKRDYAILQLLTSYGLRAKEVAALQLEDVDWQQETEDQDDGPQWHDDHADGWIPCDSLHDALRSEREWY